MAKLLNSTSHPIITSNSISSKMNKCSSIPTIRQTRISSTSMTRIMYSSSLRYSIKATIQAIKGSPPWIEACQLTNRTDRSPLRPSTCSILTSRVVCQNRLHTLRPTEECRGAGTSTQTKM